MMALAGFVLLFVLSAGLIAVAGGRLIAATDAIAERLRLGRAFIGVIIVATITSLPELSTGVSAVTLADAPDIAVGDIVGSCVFNLLLFALADVASPGVAFYARLRSAHNLTAAFGIILLGVLALSLLAPATARFSIGHVGFYSILLAALYFAGARLLHGVEVLNPIGVEEVDDNVMPLNAAIRQCAMAGATVIVAGALLAVSAERIAEAFALSDSLFGVLFVAVATSLPEMVTVLAAVRLKAYDLAAGNLLGSNLFNMLVLVIDDIAYVKGPLLATASDTLADSAVIAIVMTATIVAALNYVRRTEPHPVDAWVAWALILLYGLNAWLLLGAENLR